MEDDLLARLLTLMDKAGPDQRIPSERELVALWGTSRTALRHRLRMLEAMGALERRGAAGTYTRTVKPGDVAAALKIGLHSSTLSSASAFQPVRVALERQAVKMAAEDFKPVPVAHAEEAVMRMEKSSDPDDLYAADLAFHQAIFQASGDPALMFFSSAVGDLIAGSVSARRARMLRLANDVDEMRLLHREILEAVKAKDPAMAMAAMDRHFERIDSLDVEEEASEVTGDRDAKVS
ncbi:FCD domain-containing protein [Arthrobacter sp. OAP107]|uniref:FadR/GntR family transcriptional regulator n=1 Tax=Arthrobacter sp. OAP107 TaxID=3156445 RepID=UPI0033970FEA